MKNKEIIYKNLIDSIQGVVNEKITLKNDILIDDLLELKKAVSPINNLITSKLTERFIGVLPLLFPSIDSTKVQDLINANSIVNVNSNGYDFRDDELCILAEVKANIPYAKTKYGAAQLSGLNKDINGMLNGKAKEPNINVSKYFKFQIVLDYEKNQYSSYKAINSFIASNNFGEKVKLLSENTPIENKNIVYILLIRI